MDINHFADAGFFYHHELGVEREIVIAVIVRIPNKATSTGSSQNYRLNSPKKIPIRLCLVDQAVNRSRAVASPTTRPR